MSNPEKTVEEVVDMLKMADFEFIEPDDERRQDFFSIFQIKKELNMPFNTYVIGQALGCLGMKMYKFGHSLPANPDDTAFSVGVNDDNEEYIIPLYKKGLIREIKDLMNNEEHFQNFLKEMLVSEKKVVLSDNDFYVVKLITSSPVPFIGKIMGMVFLEIKANKITGKNSFYLVDPEFTEKELNKYLTPYKSGTKSQFDNLGIKVPGMDGADRSSFLSQREAMRKVYQFSNAKNIVSYSGDEINDFFNETFKRLNIKEEYYFERIVKNNISINNLGKNIYDEYYSKVELLRKVHQKNVFSSNIIEDAKSEAMLFIKLKEYFIKKNQKI